MELSISGYALLPWWGVAAHHREFALVKEQINPTTGVGNAVVVELGG